MESKTIKEYKKEFKKYKEKFNLDYEKSLKVLNEDLDFLESIYTTGGEYNRFSEEFKDNAHREYKEICKKTSALHSLIRE